jgi:microcin C transport system ATP-binding protein
MFISHDLKVVRALANQLIVMRNGKIVEQGEASAIFAAPQSDYTKTLMAAAFNTEVIAPQNLDPARPVTP